jgi:hypothetical protein
MINPPLARPSERSSPGQSVQDVTLAKLMGGLEIDVLSDDLFEPIVGRPV